MHEVIKAKGGVKKIVAKDATTNFYCVLVSIAYQLKRHEVQVRAYGR